jgi:hypothetical protein
MTGRPTVAANPGFVVTDVCGERVTTIVVVGGKIVAGDNCKTGAVTIEQVAGVLAGVFRPKSRRDVAVVVEITGVLMAAITVVFVPVAMVVTVAVVVPFRGPACERKKGMALIRF